MSGNVSGHIYSGLNKCVLSVFLIGALLHAGIVASEEAYPKTGAPVASLQVLESVIIGFLAEQSIPGAAVGVDLADGTRYRRGFGWANKESNIQVQPDSLFRIASVSKPITAFAILHLASEGKLDLDAPLFSSHGPLFPSDDRIEDQRVKTVTARHLLIHAGGWDRNAHNELLLRTSIIRATAELRLKDRPVDAAELVQYSLGQPLDLVPGTRYAYSNFGYTFLGCIVEATAKEPYDEYVKAKIFVPHGISDFAIGGSRIDGTLDKEVHYYDAPNSHHVQSLWPGERGVPWPYGGIHLSGLEGAIGWVASTDGLLRFAALVMEESVTGALLSDPIRREMFVRPKCANGFEDNTWSSLAGWRVRENDGQRFVWHSGNMPGSAAVVAVHPNGSRYVLLMNMCPENWESFSARILDAFWNTPAR